jgi:hypothetical protein
MDEVRPALPRIPTFVVCFMLIAVCRASHNRWSQRFGSATHGRRWPKRRRVRGVAAHAG